MDALELLLEFFREPDKHIGYIFKNISMGIFECNNGFDWINNLFY